MRRIACTLLVGFTLAVGLPVFAEENYATIVKAMQENPRGPFSRIRWFCNDGAVLPPKA